MVEVLVYGGTSEGRELTSWLAKRQGVETYVSVATALGAELLGDEEHVHTLVGARTLEEKLAFVSEHDFCCIVDATHPYATHISESLKELARETGLDLVRVSRPPLALEDGPWQVVAGVEAAAAAAAACPGNVLLTTGSHEVETFAGVMPDASERLYVRILPQVASLTETLEAHIPSSHIICMQGSGSAALNAALIRELSISCLVTKESGAAGGLPAKLEAVRSCGIGAIIIKRPDDCGGIDIETAKELLEVRYGC